MGEIGELFDRLQAVSLDVMNERAALQRRTDNKYLVELGPLREILEEVGDEHEVLEIDGERVFAYESTYFDTPSLRCFRDHARDRKPRYKARTRCYVTTGDCFFEVKVKRADGETTKSHVDYEREERRAVIPRARDLLDQVLRECALDEPDEPQPSLITAFQRVTLVARERAERTTFDFGVTARVPDGDAVEIDRRYVIAETKTAEGDGAWDRALADVGCEPISLSKYRIGMGILRVPGEDSDYAADIKRLFDAPATAR